MKWDIDGGAGDRHRIELADGRWYGWENLFTDVPRGEERMVLVESLLYAAEHFGHSYMHYTITPAE